MDHFRALIIIFQHTKPSHLVRSEAGDEEGQFRHQGQHAGHGRGGGGVAGHPAPIISGICHKLSITGNLYHIE